MENRNSETKKDEVELTMEKAVYGGDCLARLKSGKTAFIPFALPGETVSVSIQEEKRSFAKAEIRSISSPSPNRVAPPCPHFGVCGGCHYQHADYATQLKIKEQILREILLRAGVPAQSLAIDHLPSGLSSNPWAYRNRIRVGLVVNGNGSASPEMCDIQVAYRGRRSHTLIPIRECPIAAPILIQTAEEIVRFLPQNQPPIPISELELFTEPDQAMLLIALFIDSDVSGIPDPKAQGQLTSWLDSLRTSLSVSRAGIRMQTSDASLNPTVFAQSGLVSLRYKAADFNYLVPHGAFFQVNRWLVDPLVELVTRQAAGNLAWDLYAGVGLFARQLCRSFEQVIAVESAPASFPALQENLAESAGQNNQAGQAIRSTTLDFLRRNRLEREARPDLIVLDPPRAGLGDETARFLNQIHAPRMIYVSCDPSTLARDLAALTLERFKIDRITAVDMFPQTFHLETVVSLSRL